jgi:hypothetical protein
MFFNANFDSNTQRSDISLASAYINNLPADETITKRFADDDDDEVHHRIDITDREYLETRAQVQQKRQSHYKFRIGNGKPVRRGLDRRAETDEVLPAAALPIRKRSPLGMEGLARAE